MEILKVGDELSVLGYKAITLSEDMETNVSQFAKVNGLEKSEAERILSNVPALRDFIASVYSDDEEEDIVITDFNLDELDEPTNMRPRVNIAEFSAAEKTSAANAAEEVSAAPNPNDPISTTGNGIVFANDSSDNSNDIKDILGIFGLPASTTIDRELLDNDGKVNGFVINGTQYEVEVDKDGIVKTTITTPEGEVTVGQYPPPDPLVAEIEKQKNELYSLIEPLIKSTCSSFNQREVDELKSAIFKKLDKGGQCCSITTIINAIAMAISEAGYDTRNLRKAIELGSVEGQRLEESFGKMASLLAQKEDNDKIEAKYTHKTLEVGGIIFKVRYLTNSTNKCNITMSGNTITIDGKNCEVDLMGYGSSGKDIKITGENVTFRGNAVTANKITNTSRNSNITGSFGDDTIMNLTAASGTTINAADGDDKIWNYAQNAILNGDSGNDTVINYGNGSKINGGDDDDSINYVDGSATIIRSKGNDTTHLIDARIESDDPKWPYAKKYTIGGLTFIAYAKEDDFSGLSASFYKNLITVNASNMKIKVTGGTKELALKITGVAMIVQTDVTLKSVFNFADNSSITGSEGEDFLYNYADDSEVHGEGGNDTLVNEGEKADIDGGDGSDRIYNRKEGLDSHIDTDGKDKVFDSTTNSSTTISKGSMTNAEYNMAVNMAYIEAELRGTKVPSTPDASTTTKSNARNLASKLVTTDGSGKKVYSELAKKLMKYARKLNEAIGITNNTKLLEIALNKLDANKDGDITDAELNNIDAKLKAMEEEENLNLSLESLKSNIKASVGLTSSEMDKFLSSYKTTSDALKILKQIQAIINRVQSSSTSLKYTMDNIKDIMTSTTVNFNNEILEDAQMLVEASQSDDPDAYIKSKMIKDGSSQTLTQLASSTKVGDVVEKDGKLYVNDSGKMVELKISADTYLKLFPPIDRYFIEQNSYNDCFFIATTLVEAMETPKARAKILELFSESANGDITVTFPGLSPVTFTGGQLKATDGKWTQGGKVQQKNQTPTTACLGESMLEQAYAIAKFAQISNSTLDHDTIAKKYSTAMADAIKDDGKVTNVNSLDIDKALLFYREGGYATEVLDDIFGKTTNGSDEYNTFAGKTEQTLKEIMSALYANTLGKNTLCTTLISGTTKISDADKAKYNIIPGHQYSIESINPQAQTVTLKNPWDAYKTIDIPYSVFFKYFYGVLNRTIG